MSNGISQFMPAPIIPLIDCSPDEISMVQSSLRRAIPYVEAVTGLRYYPVPTIVVDRKSYEDVITIPIERDPIELLSKIKATIDFCTEVEMLIHRKSFISDQGKGIAEFDDFSDYRAYLSKSESERQYFRSRCEWAASSVWSMIINESKSVDSFEEPRLSVTEIDQVFAQYLKFMETVLLVLERLQHEGQYNTSSGNWTQFLARDNSGRIIGQCYPYPNEDDNTHRVNPFYERGRTDLQSITDNYRSAISILKKLFDEYLKSLRHEKMKQVVRKDLFGCYYHEGIDWMPPLSKLPQNSAINRNVSIHGAGVVLICLKELQDEVESLSNGSSGEINTNELSEKLILSVLIHEHTHAAVDAGMDIVSGDRKNRFNDRSKKYKRVSEALAEWSELNYFRDDPQLFEIIRDHMNCGDPDNWPYYWANSIEKQTSSGLAAAKFRTLVQYFRIATDKAYQHLRS